jgi:hypothetical protein
LLVTPVAEVVLVRFPLESYWFVTVLPKASLVVATSQVAVASKTQPQAPKHPSLVMHWGINMATLPHDLFWRIIVA